MLYVCLFSCLYLQNSLDSVSLNLTIQSQSLNTCDRCIHLILVTDFSLNPSSFRATNTVSSKIVTNTETSMKTANSVLMSTNRPSIASTNTSNIFPSQSNLVTSETMLRSSNTAQNTGRALTTDQSASMISFAARQNGTTTVSSASTKISSLKSSELIHITNRVSLNALTSTFSSGKLKVDDSRDFL